MWDHHVTSPAECAAYGNAAAARASSIAAASGRCVSMLAALVARFVALLVASASNCRRRRRLGRNRCGPEQFQPPGAALLSDHAQRSTRRPDTCHDKPRGSSLRDRVGMIAYTPTMCGVQQMHRNLHLQARMQSMAADQTRCYAVVLTPCCDSCMVWDGLTNTKASQGSHRRHGGSAARPAPATPVRKL